MGCKYADEGCNWSLTFLSSSREVLVINEIGSITVAIVSAPRAIGGSRSIISIFIVWGKYIVTGGPRFRGRPIVSGGEISGWTCGKRVARTKACRANYEYLIGFTACGISYRHRSHSVYRGSPAGSSSSGCCSKFLHSDTLACRAKLYTYITHVHTYILRTIG